MVKFSFGKDVSPKHGESKKEVVGKNSTFKNASYGESSKSAGKHVTSNTDYDVALRLQRTFDEEYTQDRSTPAAPNPSSTSVGNDHPPYPKDIQYAVDIVQRFIVTVMKTQCHKCRSELVFDFDVEKWFRNWSGSRHQKQASSICALTCPNNNCRALTCLGCGDKPREGKFVGKHKIDGLVVDWCCEDGRMFAIWALLCRYDHMELKLQLQQREVRGQLEYPHNAFVAKKLGLAYPGFTRKGKYMPQIIESKFGGPPVLIFAQADNKTDKATKTLLGLIIELLPLRNEVGKAAPPEISAMIELSLLQDRAAELLRNDSLQDATGRAGLYFALFEFFERLGKHPDTEHLVYEKRFPKKQSNGLQAISTLAATGSKGKAKSESAPSLILGDFEHMGASLVSCMKNLAKQSKVLIKTSQAASKEFRTAEGEDVLEIAHRVAKLYDSMAADSSSGQKKSGTTWEEFHQNQCMVTEDNIMAYLDARLASKARALAESPRNRIKRLVTEISELSTSLPLNIFVKADTVRPDVMKCLIVGPEGTPYECGLFEFDIFCSASYPNYPPEVSFRTTAGGKVRFNPNMYQNGKVCLSLLGTWPGPPESKWQAGKSTLLSVLVSIQALILCANPLTNEPPSAGAMASIQGRTQCRTYDRTIEVLTLRFGILDWLRRPAMRDGVWRDVLGMYFRAHKGKILAVARRWAESNGLVRGYDGRAEMREWGDFLKSGGKVDLVTELESALERVGG